MKNRKLQTLSTASVALAMLAGCDDGSRQKIVATPPVRVEREKPAIADMTPGERAQAYQDACDQGAVRLKEGQYGLALGAFETALEIEPDSTAALFNLGACHEAIGDPLRAINLYRRVLDATPNDSDCYRNLGTSYIKLYVREKSPAWRKMALDAWRRSLQIQPEQPDVQAFLDHGPTVD